MLNTLIPHSKEQYKTDLVSKVTQKRSKIMCLECSDKISLVVLTGNPGDLNLNHSKKLKQNTQQRSRKIICNNHSS